MMDDISGRRASKLLASTQTLLEEWGLHSVEDAMTACLVFCHAAWIAGATVDLKRETVQAFFDAAHKAVRLELAQLLKEMGREAEARTEARRVLETEPSNEAARRLAAGS